MKTCRLPRYRWGWAWVSKALVEGNTPRAGKGKTQTKLWSSQAAWMHEAWDYVSHPPRLWRSQEGGWVSVQPALAFCIASPSVEDIHQKEKKEEAHSNLHSWDVPQIGVPDTIHVGERERWWTPRIHRWGISDEEEPSGKNISWWLKLVWHILTIQKHSECIVLKTFSTK